MVLSYHPGDFVLSHHPCDMMLHGTRYSVYNNCPIRLHVTFSLYGGQLEQFLLSFELF